MEGEAQISSSEPAQTAPIVSDQSTSQEATVSHESEPSQSQEGGLRPEGFDKVEFTPEQKARVDRIYGNMKRYENDAKELREHNQKLIDAVNNLYQGQTQIVSHLKGNDFQEAETRLTEKRQDAWSKGDVNAFNEANDKLHEIKTQRLLADQEARRQPVPQPQTQQQTPKLGGERIVNRAIDQGEISSTDATIARSWMSETDNSGNLKRPWTSESDPRNYAAALEGQAVFNSPLFANKSVAEKLREIDRRMGLMENQNAGQNVLPSGNLTRGKQSNNLASIKLDPKIEDLAVRQKFAGRDPKFTAQDHIDAWKKAVIKSQPKQGARR